jgi:hypothetical protein
MSTSSRRLLISIVVLLVVFCLCTAALAFGGILAWFAGQSNQSSNLQPPGVLEIVPEYPAPTWQSSSPNEPAREATPRPDSANPPVPTPPTSGEIPVEVLQQLETIQEQVIELRGLLPDNRPFQQTVLSPDQLQERVMDDFLQDYTPEDMQTDQVVLNAFGLLEPDYDLIQMYRDLYSEQIAGFYDNETREMVIVQSQEFGGLERSTYAHEYTHALQDQNYNFKDGLQYSDEACEFEGDRCAAVLALLEGDASLSEEDWVINFSTLEDKQDLLDFYSTYESPVFDSAPTFLQEDFLFPYLQGKLFVEAFQNQSGWSGTNKLYADPPVSTEQILHPDRYPQDIPQPVELGDLADLLGPGWVELDKEVLGEWYTYLVLARGQSLDSRIGDTIAAAAADGWGGDRYLVFRNPETSGVILVLKTVWDTSQDAREFASAFVTYADGRFGAGSQDSPSSWSWNSLSGSSLFSLDEQNSETIWILAPDNTLSQAVQAALTLP